MFVFSYWAHNFQMETLQTIGDAADDAITDQNEDTTLAKVYIKINEREIGEKGNMLLC